MLRVSISLSRTAQLFHVVDQLAAWSPYCHAQYARHVPLNDEDRRLLGMHAALRKRHGWGQGLEQAFYVDAPLDQALAAAGSGLLSPDEAREERVVLEHFEPLLRGLIDADQERLERFRAHLIAEAPRLRERSDRFALFTEAEKPIVVPAFLIANPDQRDGGGGYDGGRLVVEAFADEATGEMVFLQEGIAYAFAPGLEAFLQKACPIWRGVQAMPAEPK
jgi:hypothetical protein